jgi:hypothetical protein
MPNSWKASRWHGGRSWPAHQISGDSTGSQQLEAELRTAASTKANPLTPSSTVGNARSTEAGDLWHNLATTVFAHEPIFAARHSLLKAISLAMYQPVRLLLAPFEPTSLAKNAEAQQIAGSVVGCY